MIRKYNVKQSNLQKKEIRDDIFVSKTQFDDIKKLYIFDKKLRLLAIDALERIEMALRVEVAYTLGKQSPIWVADIFLSV